MGGNQLDAVDFAHETGVDVVALGVEDGHTPLVKRQNVTISVFVFVGDCCAVEALLVGALASRHARQRLVLFEERVGERLGVLLSS